MQRVQEDSLPGGRDQAHEAGDPQELLQVLSLPQATGDGPHSDAWRRPVLSHLLQEGLCHQGLRLWYGLTAAGDARVLW